MDGLKLYGLVVAGLLIAACSTLSAENEPGVLSTDISAIPPEARATAEAAIPAHRAGVFTLFVVDADGNPVPRAEVALRQVRHEFIFGGQIPFWFIDPAYADQGDQAAVLQRAGVMFEQVIPSQITWGWVEPERGTLDFSRYDFAAVWARELGKRTLIQHLFWGLYDDTHELNPAWLKALEGEDLEAALRQRISDAQANMGKVDGIVVLNESMYQNIYNDRLGTDITPVLFAAAREAFPDADLYINENPWQAVDLGLTPPGDLDTPMDHFIAHVQRLDQNGVDFDKVGLQIYLEQSDVEAFGGIQPFVSEVDALLNRFAAETGRSLIITEYGMSAPDERFRAEFLEAFMQMVFANPIVDGFQIFHWLDEQLPDNALVRIDGSLSPAGETYLRLLEGWTTRLQGQTDSQGAFAFRGAFGMYEVVVTVGGQEETFMLDLGSRAPGETTLTLSH